MKIGLNRKTVNIEVCEKTFKIGIFPIICEYLIVKNDVIERAWEKQENKTSEELQKKNKAQLDIQFEILENLLIANGYEYDEKWWKSRLDLLGVQEFIVVAKSKDVIEGSKKKSQNSRKLTEIDFEKLYFALKSKGMVNNKEEFWLQMDIKDASEAGAFVPTEVWKKYIVKEDETPRILVKPVDFRR